MYRTGSNAGVDAEKMAVGTVLFPIFINFWQRFVMAKR